MRQALLRYPKHQPRLRGADATSDVPMQPADDEATMKEETGSAASSTTRRPKAKARPRRATIIADVILIRYDSPRNLGSDLTSRRGQFLLCGVDIDGIGPISQDRVCQLIEEASDQRDRQLPQRGDRPKYAINADTGHYDNAGYACMSDGVKGGLLDLLPIEGARFIHSKWNIIDTCRLRDLNRRAMNNASWALTCIQMDLRHHIGRVAGTTYLDGRGSTRFQDVIRCDEGGWVHIDDLVRMEVLWSSQSRGITTTASHTDEEQRRRIYNEKIQLLINGNLLGARQRNGKVRLQFLGVRLKDPPAGPYDLGVPGSNVMVETRSDRRIAEQPLHQR